jgi:hypothetical protein
MPVRVFGIRHHGPGCARALRSALETMAPDVVLVEGPPDANEVLPLLGDTEMSPPVALLIYRPDAPAHAVFYPFSVFSPEWQALSFAFERHVPARFMDLPQTHRLADEAPPEVDPVPAEAVPTTSDAPADPVPTGADASPTPWREDPLGLLAEAAGYTDHELWWEHQIEQRQDPAGLFDGIMEAMTALRSVQPDGHADGPVREAHMRQTIRAALKEGFGNIAVVCGAWHAPVLQELGPAKPDAELLRGLPKVKVAATWIPWTHSRLSYRSGYGAGIASPGWYEHLWRTPDRAVVRWVARAARLLREEDLDASSAGVIESVRLAEALAALRGIPLPGLAELNEAVQSALCRGEPAPMLLIRDRLEIGDCLGHVPAATPTVPLQRDLEAQQKSLRLKPSPTDRPLDLDLRTPTDLARSRLLHRLGVLGIPWGRLQPVRGKAGTFHELWQVKWDPAFAVAVIEAGVWGHTVADAADAAARHAADGAPDLGTLTQLLDGAVLADLTAAITYVLDRVQAQAAVAADVRHLMAALPPLARVARYGDVRQTRTEQVAPIIRGLFERVLVSLPLACGSLDDDAAAQMVENTGGVQGALDLLDDAALRTAWQGVLQDLLERDNVHGLVRGWFARLLLEKGCLAQDALSRLARLALARAHPPAQAAAWIEGLLRGSGMLLLQLDGLWRALDAWLCDLHAEVFMATLPLLRRAFANFAPPERRAMGEKVKRLGDSAAPSAGSTAETDDLDAARVARVLPILAHVLGVSPDGLE